MSLENRSEKPPAPLLFKRFEEGPQRSLNFLTSRNERAKLDSVQSEAREWINGHPEFEIVTIDSSTGPVLTTVTVWYRLIDRPSKQSAEPATEVPDPS